MLSRLIIAVLFSFAMAAITATGQSQVLVNYEFSGGSSAGTNVAANMAAGNAIWTNMANANSGFSATFDDAFARFDAVGTTTLNADRYLEFTLSATPGYFLNLSSVDFSIGYSSTATFNRTSFANARSSIDSFASDLLMTPGPTNTASIGTNAVTSPPIYNSYDISLGDPTFSNLSSFTFRLYPSVTAISANNSFLRFDNVVFNGTVEAVPEPTTWGLLGFGLVVLAAKIFGRRRRETATAYSPRR